VTSTVEQAHDYLFVRKPKWVISHVLVAALVAAMLVAGLWQVNRHGERADRNDLVTARVQQDPVQLALVAPPGSDPMVGETEQFLRVVVTGEYRPEDEVLIRNRTFEGSPGWWVVTPFVTDDGWGVAVNRGWIPRFFEADEPRPGTEAATGRIEIVGMIQPARLAEGFQVADPEEGRLSSLGRPDVARLAQQVDYDMSPVIVRIAPATVEAGALPTPLELPPIGAGPHLSYAAQWFIFSTIALVGYPLILRRIASGEASSSPEWDDELLERV
jgi:cytochrome oxidase assembly protein ShyY1